MMTNQFLCGALVLAFATQLGGQARRADGAKFQIIDVQTPAKQSVLAGVERDFFSRLPQEQWDTLAYLLEVTFQFEPTRGNTEYLEDTFLLTVHDMGVTVAGKSFPAIGVKTSFGFHQKSSYNAGPDFRRKYCQQFSCQSTMYFLVSHKPARFMLVYRDTPVADNAVARRR